MVIRRTRLLDRVCVGESRGTEWPLIDKKFGFKIVISHNGKIWKGKWKTPRILQCFWEVTYNAPNYDRFFIESIKAESIANIFRAWKSSDAGKTEPPPHR